jgi:hypothetical protein
MYADDLKLFRRVAAQADCIHLQSDLDVIADRFQSHGLVLNINKCKVLTFTNKKNILRYKYKQYRRQHNNWEGQSERLRRYV